MTNETVKTIITTEFSAERSAWVGWYDPSATKWKYHVIDLVLTGRDEKYKHWTDTGGNDWVSENYGHGDRYYPADPDILEPRLLDAGWEKEELLNIDWQFKSIADHVSGMESAIVADRYINTYLNGNVAWQDIAPYLPRFSGISEKSVRMDIDFYRNTTRQQELIRRRDILMAELGDQFVIGHAIMNNLKKNESRVRLAYHHVYQKGQDAIEIDADRAVRGLIASVGDTKLRAAMMELASGDSVLEYMVDDDVFDVKASLRVPEGMTTPFVDVAITGDSLVLPVTFTMC